MRKLAIVASLLLLSAGTIYAQSDMGTQDQIDRGKVVYDKYCSQCHGYEGDGQGYATPRLKPEPRDFTSGKYKFRTTPNGKLPTDADVIRVIKEGLPYTSMPGWPQISDPDIQNIVYYLKTMAPDWQNPDSYGEPYTIPAPPTITPDSIERGAEAYVAQGCGACHGDLGRGDGLSAKTLTDDWGDHIRPADMHKRWTFRGGPSRTDIYRTFTTGLNGTPMPSYADTMDNDARWDLVNYIYSLADSDTPDYASLLVVDYIDEEIDINDGEATAALFDAAPMGRFPLVGQIVEPGRGFYPSALDVEVRAIYNRKEIAIQVQWHDISAERSGTNSPAMEVPLWDEDNDLSASSGSDSGDDEGGFWGFEEEEEATEEDIWGAEVVDEDSGGDIWGDDAVGEDDFWGDGSDDGGSDASGYTDAVAIQFPSKMPSGNRKPYFIFGDGQSSVDLWFFDLARDAGLAEQYLGRGAAAIEISESDEIDVISNYDKGRWTVTFKRTLKARGGISIEQEMFLPVAFSAWDGFNNERGNKRALSQWVYFYLEPAERTSAVGPMLRTAGLVLLAEIILVIFIRRRHAAERAGAPEGSVPEGSSAS